MPHIPQSVDQWLRVGASTFLHQTTLYPLLLNLSTKPHLCRDDLEYYSECLSIRSKMVMNGLLAIVGFTLSSSISTNPPTNMTRLVALTFLLWCIINRTYYEGLPLDEFQVRYLRPVTPHMNAKDLSILQKRIQNSTPGLVAILYAVPEVYQVVFIAYQLVFYAEWIGVAILVGILLAQAVIRFVWVKRLKLEVSAE
ncbi:hypothetical protein DL96DRAFT_1724324 [Flagelloscypha sp. PMI_526]|nr:hypothetical protein DL96DRAFT_1724324 [Flagelloscypha sp. PMI_526]